VKRQCCAYSATEQSEHTKRQPHDGNLQVSYLRTEQRKQGKNGTECTQEHQDSHRLSNKVEQRHL
jgi:hypothetical protein